MSKELVGNLAWKKGYRMWKKVLDTWKEYRNIVRTCKDATRKARTLLELNLVREVKSNKKGFFRYISKMYQYILSKMHPQVLRALAEVAEKRALSFLKGHGGQDRCLRTGG